jgi:hypothetical protein
MLKLQKPVALLSLRRCFGVLRLIPHQTGYRARPFWSVMIPMYNTRANAMDGLAGMGFLVAGAVHGWRIQAFA